MSPVRRAEIWVWLNGGFCSLSLHAPPRGGTALCLTEKIQFLATSALVLCTVGRELAFSISKQKYYCAFFRIHINKYLSYSCFCYAVPILLRLFSNFMPSQENNNRHGNLGKQKAWGSNDWQLGLFFFLKKPQNFKVCFCQRHKNLTTILFLSSHTHHTFLKAVSKTCYVQSCDICHFLTFSRRYF